MTRRSIRRSRSHPQKQALPEKACRCIPQKKEDFVMEGKMKVAVMLGTGQMGFEERDIPKAKDNEVLVKLEYVGICGSDLHYYETGAIGDYVVKPPFVLGHEPGGTVVEVGKNVKHLKAGED